MFDGSMILRLPEKPPIAASAAGLVVPNPTFSVKGAMVKDSVLTVKVDSESVGRVTLVGVMDCAVARRMKKKVTDKEDGKAIAMADLAMVEERERTKGGTVLWL